MSDSVLSIQCWNPQQAHAAMTAQLSRHAKDISKMKFGMLTVLSFSHSNSENTFWNCLCECGQVKILRGRNMTSGTATSCGCNQHQKSIIANSKHGQAGKTRTYKIWTNMHTRCSNPKATGYERYGGRGISVCERWRDFSMFFEDMGEATGNLSIDRIDSNGNYEKENCKWATKTEQSRNTNRIIYVDYDGRSRKLVELCDELCVSYNMAKKRIKRGWSVSDSLLVESQR